MARVLRAARHRRLGPCRAPSLAKAAPLPPAPPPPASPTPLSRPTDCRRTLQRVPHKRGWGGGAGANAAHVASALCLTVQAALTAGWWPTAWPSPWPWSSSVGGQRVGRAEGGTGPAGSEGGGRAARGGLHAHRPAPHPPHDSCSHPASPPDPSLHPLPPLAHVGHGLGRRVVDVRLHDARNARQRLHRRLLGVDLGARLVLQGESVDGRVDQAHWGGRRGWGWGVGVRGSQGLWQPPGHGRVGAG